MGIVAERGERAHTFARLELYQPQRHGLYLRLRRSFLAPDVTEGKLPRCLSVCRMERPFLPMHKNPAIARPLRPLLWGAGLALAVVLLGVGHGFAAQGAAAATAGNGASGSGHAEALLVAQLLLLIVTGRILGEAMQRIGQPALMGQILAGICLGPSLLGWLWPSAQHLLFPADVAQKGMIDGIAQVGILLLLLLTGMETDLRLVKKSGFASVAIALCGIAFPFACGFLLGEFGPASLFGGGNRLVTSLFLGTALSISSIKIVAMVVREMNFMRRNLGQVIVATAIMEDTVGWVIIAVIFGLAGAGAGAGGSGGAFDWMDVARTLAGVILFMAFCFTAGRWLVSTAIRWANDSFRSEFPVITMILAIMSLLALVTHLLGVRDVLGAFMAGVLIGESPILTAHIQQQLRGLIVAFFMPVFFGLSGLSADLTILTGSQIALLTAGLVVIASFGKFSGAFAGAMLGRLTWREGVALGCAMNARGSTEVIVASIGLSMGALTGDLYTMIVTMALVTTMAMPPMLRAALARIPMTKEEEVRIERETVDARGFVPGLERLLLAGDDSAAGRMAARLTGLVAGSHGMPVTIIRLDGDLRGAAAEPQESGEQGKKKSAAPQHSEHSGAEPDASKEVTGARVRKAGSAELREDRLAREVIAGARRSAAKVIADQAEPDPDHVHLTRLVPVDAAADVVRDEARKGYDLLFIGLGEGVGADGGFSARLTRIAAGFEGPLAVLAPGDGDAHMLSARSRILVPVNGSGPSRRAAEIAFALARGTGAGVRCLFVSQGDGQARTRAREEGVLKDMAELAERYDVQLTTHISARAGAGDVVVREARRGYGLVVMGAGARPGEELYFGNTATAVLAGAGQPVLIVGS
jgi:Kef-type K+ transport system membrane component KefB/nucleotide-binding universal stress UspA family protein